MKRDLSDDLKAKVRAIIDDMLGQYDIEQCRFEVRDDATGDEAIFIDLTYRLNAKEFDGSVINQLRSAVRSVLIDSGDDRFPYIRHRLPEGQKVKAA